MSSKIRISAAAVLALTFTALLVTNRPAYRTPALPVLSTSTSITFNAPPSSSDHDAMGTFATEKLKVTSTASDAIVDSGGMQMLGPLSVTGVAGSTSATIGATSTDRAINATSVDGNAVRGFRAPAASTTDDIAAVIGNTAGTFAVAGGNLYNYGVRGQSTATKSSGAGNLHDWGVFGRAGTEGGAANVAYELVGVQGMAFEGASYSIGLSGRGGSQNGITMGLYGQGDTTGTGTSFGALGYARTGDKRVGVLGVAPTGGATSNIGVWARLGAYSETPPVGSFALYSDGATKIDGALDMNTHLINNVVDPASPQDAATKAYVDAATSGAISGSGTANTVPKFTGASAIGNSQLTDDGTTVAVGGADLTINTTTNTLDWQGGFLTIAGSGSLIIGNSGGVPVTTFIVSATTGNVTMNSGDLSVVSGTVNVGSGAVILAPAGTVAATGAITADSGLRVFDVAGNGLTSSTNTVHVDAPLGGGITINPDSIQMTFCAANQIPQMNAGGTAWTCAAASSGTVTSSVLTANTVPKATGASAIGNSTITDDGTTVAVNGNKLTVDVTTGNTLIAGTLDVTSDFKVNTNKFTVNGVSGDTALAGALTVATNRLTVNATTGDTAALGALTADGGLRVFDVAGAGLTSSTNTVNAVATSGGGLTVNANDIQMTFCAANQIPQMNAGGTAWTCAAASSGTIGGSATSPGVIYASAANTAATDATAFTYNATQDAVFIGSSAVTTADTLSALDVSTGISGGTPIASWATNTAGYSGMVWNTSAVAYAGSMGYGNSAVAVTALRGNNFFASASGVNYVFNDAAATGTNLITLFMTSGSTGTQWTNGSSAAVGAASTGKLIYNSTTNTFRASLNGGAYTDVITGAVAANTIPKSNNSTTGVLTASTITDNGTTVSTTLPFTSSGTVTGLFLSGDVAGSAPTVTTCGTSPVQPAATDTNVTGKFTTGSGTGTTCTLTFAGTAANAPQCYLLPDNAGAVGPFQSSSTTTSATWTGTLVASTPYRYICLR